MGAAGYITIYDEQKVREAYTARFPDRNIDKDWWYLNTITATLDGKKWIMDYWDDQGHHEGSRNDFWFASMEAQDCVRSVLREVHRTDYATEVEVWT